MATVHNMDEHTLAKVREVAESSKLRFMMDLEFVEGLANPRYLNFLAVEQNFTKPSFLNYIRYLQVCTITLIMSHELIARLLTVCLPSPCSTSKILNM